MAKGIKSSINESNSVKLAGMEEDITKRAVAIAKTPSDSASILVLSTPLNLKSFFESFIVDSFRIPLNMSCF